MTEGLHWLYRGTPRMDFTPMTSKKYVSVTGWRIWEGLVCVCVCVFLFIHSYIQFSPQNSFQHLLVSFSLHPTFKTFKVQTPEMQTISMQAIFCHAVLFTNTFFLFMSEQRSILLTQCYWIPNYPRVLNFWFISHGLMLVFLDTCFFQLPDSYEFWYLCYWQMRGLTTEGMREIYLSAQHCNMQSRSFYRVKARAEIKSSWSSWSNITPLRRSVQLQDLSLFQMM